MQNKSEQELYFSDNLQLAEQGDAEAQFLVGEKYNNDKEYSESIKWYHKAAEQECAKAQCKLGECHWCGKGVEQDYSKAVKWYRKAAEQGNIVAQCHLGELYANGWVVEQDNVKAAKYYRMAAEQFEDEIHFKLSSYYYVADVEENYSTEVRLLHNEAKAGDSYALFHLGVCYYEVEKKYDEAAKCFRKATEQHNDRYNCHPAYYFLGKCYYNGQGVEQNYFEAVKWWYKAVETGWDDIDYYHMWCAMDHPYCDGVEEECECMYREFKAASQLSLAAQLMLGTCFEYGRGVQQDYSEAISWYTDVIDGNIKLYTNDDFDGRRGIDEGNTNKIPSYRNWTYRNRGLYSKGYLLMTHKEDEDIVVTKLYHKAIENNDIIAQYNLGCCYENGSGVDEDMAEAVSWWRKAAQQNHADAQFRLGQCYYNGKGVKQSWHSRFGIDCFGEKQNLPEAARWWHKAAEQGHSAAQFNLGLCYEKAEGVEQNYTEAMTWYCKVAEQGHVDAQYKIGWYYYNGLSVDINHSEAVKWLSKAAEQGNGEAQYLMGQCYFKGEGVKQSNEEAIKWWRKSAEQGHSIAQNNLGWCYIKGEIVEKDYDMATTCWHEAARNGDSSASFFVDWYHSYKQSEGKTDSYDKMIESYRKRAEEGFPGAKFVIGIHYAYDNGFDKQSIEAKKWWRLAMETGNVDVLYCLGWCYEWGVGVKKTILRL